MLSLTSGKRPDITPAQIVGLIPVVATLLHVFGVYDLSQEQADALKEAVAAGFVLFGADAVIRTGRNQADAKVQAAAVGQPVNPAAREQVALVPRRVTPGERLQEASFSSDLPHGVTSGSANAGATGATMPAAMGDEPEPSAEPPFLPDVGDEEPGRSIGDNAGDPPVAS